MVVTYLAGSAMAISHFGPYVSEFEFSSRFHPSKNPDCTSGNAGKGSRKFKGANFASWRSRRSPEEGSPVGQEPSIEVRAILVRCPRTEQETDDVLINRNIYNITAGRSQDILDFHGFDRDEPAHHSEVRDCRRKLIVTMKFNNIGKTKTQEEFVVIDHVLDPVTMHKSRLLNPFVVKVRQEPVLQLYGLKFQGVVNAEAREEVINKKLSNYTGCDDNSENPTCGQMIFEGKPIPYSQGFCCSCDPELNNQREASIFNESVVPPFSSFFSKIKDRQIRPFKSPRSVNENFSDSLLDLEETSQNEATKNEEPHGNLNNALHNFDLPEDNNLTLNRNSHDDETDLRNLKNPSRLTNKKIYENWDVDEIVNKRTIEPYKTIDYQISLRGRSNTLPNSHKEMFSNYQPTDIRYMSTSHNSGRVNLTAELRKLEEDYKKLQLSGLMRAKVRKNKMKATEKQKLHSSTGQYSDHIANDNRTNNFLSSGRIENKMPTRIGNDRQDRISTSTHTRKFSPVTLSIDVLLAIRPKQKSSCPVHSITALLTTCPMEGATTRSIPETVTPVVFRQKLVSDRVYPSSNESRAYKFDEEEEIGNSKSMKTTTKLSQKFGTDIVDLENDATSDDAETYKTQTTKPNPAHIPSIESRVNTFDEEQGTGHWKSIKTATTLIRKFGTDFADLLENVPTSNDAESNNSQWKVNDRIHPSSIESTTDKLDEQQEIGHSNSMDTTTNLGRKIGTDVIDLFENVSTSDDKTYEAQSTKSNPAYIPSIESKANTFDEEQGTGHWESMKTTTTLSRKSGTDIADLENLSTSNDANSYKTQWKINDRTHLSSIESKADKFDEQQEIGHSNSMKNTTNLSRKFGTDELLENIVASNDVETYNKTHPNMNQTSLKETYEATSSENSMNSSPDIETGFTITSTENLQHTVDSTQTFDNPSSQVEGAENSSSIFSSGNHPKGHAILLSGSLKNQLANWFTYDKRKKFGWEGGRKKSREDGEIGSNGEVGFFGLAIPTSETDNLANGRRYDDQLTTTLGIRRPVEIHLAPDDSYEISYSTDNGKSTSKTSENISVKAFLDPEEIVVPLSNKSGRLKVSRSYRSIADDDSILKEDNEQQRSIDKKIEDEFLDISEALKDAADGPKIIRGRPSSESIFEKDNSVIHKFDLILNDVPGSKMMENHLQSKDPTENPTLDGGDIENETLKHTERFGNTETPKNEGHDLPVNKLNANKIDGAKIIRQNLARGSSVEADNSKGRNFSPVFDDMTMRESNKYDNHFQHDEQTFRSLDFESNGSDTQSKLVKHTEVFDEPVSEIPLTTDHKIIVDRFKIVKTFQELPASFKLTSKKPMQSKDVSPKMQDLKENVAMLKKNVAMADTTLHWTSVLTSDGRTETVSEAIQDLGPQIIVDRFKPVNRLQETTNGPSNLGNLKEGKFLTDTPLEPIPIVRSDDTFAARNDTSFHSSSSPVPMIENLKKELRKEAEHYSSEDNQRPLNLVDEVREVNTELTPAEKVEDWITDQETLPPDEETKSTAMSLSKTTIVPSSIRRDSTIELKKMNDTLLPRLALQVFETSLPTKMDSIPSKRPNEILIVLEEPKPRKLEMSSATFLHLGNKRSHKKRHRRRHHHRQKVSRNKKRSTETKLNVTHGIDHTINSVHLVTNEKNENEDDEHPWYDSTTNTGKEIAEKSGSEVTMTAANMDLNNYTLKNLKRREISSISVVTIQNNQPAIEFPNKTASSGKLYVSLSKIPESHHQSKLGGLRVEEIPKAQHKAEMDIDVDDVKTLMMTQSSLTEALEEIDEIPNFQRTGPPIMDDESKGGKSFTIDEKGLGFIRKIRNTEGIGKINVQTLSTPKFRSLYPISDEINSMSATLVDEVTGREGIERNNKRDDSMNSDESEPEALIFYDYDAVDSGLDAPVTEERDDDNKRSLDSLDPAIKNDEKFQSSAKSAAMDLKRSPRQSFATRSQSTSQNNYFSRSNNEELDKNPLEGTTVKSYALLDKKGRRSMNMSGDEFRIEPSGGWKDKMELLKLKKHADVLKEYLNWRHDIVPPEPHGISGYTTMISVTNEKVTTTEFVTTHHLNLTNETTLAGTIAAYSSVTDDASSTIHDRTAFTTNNDDVAKETQTFSPSESTSISSASSNSGNCSFNGTNSTEKMETSTSNLHYETEGKAANDNEASTGRILPPCCPTTKNVVTMCPTGLHRNFDRLPSPPHLSKLPQTMPKVVSNNRGQLSNVENDLVVISVMEKNRLGNKRGGVGNHQDTSLPKIYRIQEEEKPDKVSYHRRYKSKKKIKHPPAEILKKAKPNQRTGRRLMAVEDLDYKTGEEEDLTFDDFGDNINEVSSVDGDTDAFDYNRDSEELKNKWNHLIDKVIHTNSSDFWTSANSSKLPLSEFPGDNRSAMKQLHFINADKYIRQMAKKIAHKSNIHDTKLDVGGAGHKNRGRHVLGRKLKSYPRLAGKKVSRKARTKDNEDSSHRNADSNDTSNQETPDGNESGRDFAISVSGKIHVEGGTNGQPMSISFDTSPEISNRNENVQGNSNETSDNSTNPETDPNPNILSRLFNTASITKEPAHHWQEPHDNFNSSASNHQTTKVDATKLRSSREDGHRKLPHLPEKSVFVRKYRAVDEDEAAKFPKYRDDRSFDLEDSQDLEDIPEESDSEDYPESVFADNNDLDHEEANDSQLPLPRQRNLNSRLSTSDMAGDVIHEHRKVYSPDVKVIKVIPLDVSFPSDSTRNNEQAEVKEDSNASRMTASQLPKMEDELVPGKTVKPGRIKPAVLPWKENDSDDDRSRFQDMDTQQDSRASGSCSPKSESAEENLEEDAFNTAPDRQFSTTNPVSLKVIGLVSMEQPLINDTKNPDNYEIVPLIHVKIEQQSNDKENLNHPYVLPAHPDNHASNFPSGRMKGCPEIQMTKSPQHFHGGGSCSCSEMDYDEDKTEDNCNPDHEVATMNMDNDEELREPSGIGSCPQSNPMPGPIRPYFADEKFEHRPTESHSCGDHPEMTTTSKTRQGNVNKSGAGKSIRLKNMLAIMEFMKKMRGLISGDETQEMTDMDNNNGEIKLASIVVLPINRSKEILEKPPELDETTDRVVMIGEGLNHGRPNNEVISDENQSKFKECNGTSLKAENKFNDTGSNTSNWKATPKDQDKSFLFYGIKDKIGTSSQNSDLPSTDSGQERLTDSPNVGLEDRESLQGLSEAQQHNTELYTKLKEPEVDKSVTSNSTNSSLVNPSDSPNGNEVLDAKNPQKEDDSKERNVLENLQKKINDRLRGLKNVNLERNERRDVDLSEAKSHRLRSNRMTHGIRDARRKMYRSRSLPTGGDISVLRSQKFRRLAAGKGNPKGKRKRKKKKMKKRRKKKKHKKKKGKNLRDTEVKGKAWWPFGRQLMSLSEERKLASDTNLYEEQIEGTRIEESRNRVPSKYRNRRRVHRAKFPHGKRKKMKKRRKHKKTKKKKKKGKESEAMRLRSKRQIRPGGSQVRGGQDCMDRRHPPNVNPAKYLESAHCLRFSDLWYSVYELESPIMEHTVYLQLFEKHNRADGTTHWEDLTQGSMVRMGSFTKHQRDSTPTIVFTYSGAKIEPQNRALNLDPSRERLLVPSPVPPKKAPDYPEVRGGSGEYLVVKASAISKDGNECDKAGVGFAAFSKQQDRCGRPKGSCLKNQPLAYWRHDMEARESGRPGCYFLSNFASVPTKPIKYNVSGSGSREYLGLEYHSTHVSAIDIEVRTDYNAIVRVGSSGRVTEVYVDSTALEHTVVTVVISNMGLASSPYQPRITDCPTGLPVSWTKAKGIMQVIPPQHDQRVTLDLYGQLLLNGFHCSVEVVNHRGELVAMRRIRVQKMDRCFCVWHCLCACIGSVSGMGCQPMSPEHYHAAGFQGPVPVVTSETSILMVAVKNVLMISALLVLLLLILGMLKWFVGMFAPAVGRWGLDSLLEGSRIEEYLEPELRCRCVMTDDDGWPVHPDTGQRTVRVCSRKFEFVLNLIFFLTYPIAVCCTFFKRSLNSSRHHRCCPDESKMCLINEKRSCPKMICVNTYGDNRNSKLEAEDTRYVMEELKKSQESLQNPKRTKNKDGNKNGPKYVSTKSLHKNKSASGVSAKRLIDDLLKSRMVFRNLTEPIGGLRVPPGTTYSLRGYFLNAEDGGYRFITPCPFKQHWLIEKNEKKVLAQPEIYPSSLFMRSFVTARDVYESNELSLKPKGICINVQYQDDA